MFSLSSPVCLHSLPIKTRSQAPPFQPPYMYGSLFPWASALRSHLPTQSSSPSPCLHTGCGVLLQKITHPLRLVFLNSNSPHQGDRPVSMIPYPPPFPLLNGSFSNLFHYQISYLHTYFLTTHLLLTEIQIWSTFTPCQTPCEHRQALRWSLRIEGSKAGPWGCGWMWGPAVG